MRLVNQKSGRGKDYKNLLRLPDSSLAVGKVPNLSTDLEYRFTGLEPPSDNVRRL